MPEKLKYRFTQAAAGQPGATSKIYLYDDISSVGEFNWETWENEESETSAKHMQEQLDAIPNGGTIEVHVNSCGGEVGEGTAIYNLLRQKSSAGNKVIGYVDGFAYSIAMTIMMACDERHMGLGTSMFLHFPSECVCGNAAQLRDEADNLDSLGEASLQLYMDRAHDITEDEVRQMMEKETLLTPDECLAYGFCDFIDTYKAEPDGAPEEDTKQQEIDDLKHQLADRKFLKQEVTEMLQSLKKPTVAPVQQEPEPKLEPKPEPEDKFSKFTKAMSA